MCNEKEDAILTPNDFQYTEEMQKAQGEMIAKSKQDAYYENLGDVHWEDLEFYLNNARKFQDKENFEISIKILDALKAQVLERKSK